VTQIVEFARHARETGVLRSTDLPFASVQEIDKNYLDLWPTTHDASLAEGCNSDVSQSGKAPIFVEDPACGGEIIILGIDLTTQFQVKTVTTI
jgi:hypothetical protein